MDCESSLSTSGFVHVMFFTRWDIWGPIYKYLTTILRLSYDNVKATIDLRRTYNLQNII